MSPESPPTEAAGQAPPRAKKARGQALVMRLIGVAGLGLFVYLVYRIGIPQIWQALRRLTFLEMLALLGLRIFYYGVRTANWRALLAASGEKVPFLDLYGARMAGNAVGYLTPAGNLGTETMRVLMLDTVDRKKVVATVVIDKTIEFLSGLFAMALSVLFVVVVFALPNRQKIILLALTAGGVAVLVFLMAKQKYGLLTWLVDLAGALRIRIPAIEKRRERIRETDAHIADFYRQRRGLFFLLFGSYFLQTLVWAAEIYVTFLFIDSSQASYLKSFLIVTLGSFYTILPVPGAMGVYELTYVSLFALLRIEMTAGMAVILIRRILAIVWSGLGLVPLLRKRAASGAGRRDVVPAQADKAADLDDNIAE